MTKLIAVAGLLLISGAAHGQQMIAKDVAEDLLGMAGMMMGPGGAKPTIVIGKVAPDLEGKVYLAPTTRVLASMDGMFSTTVLSSSRSPDSAIADLNREMPKLGWRAAPPQGQQPWGFRPQPSALKEAGTVFCTDQATVMAMARSQGPKETRIILMTVPSGDACNANANIPDQRMGMRERMRAPTLDDPPPTAARLRCGNFGGSSGSSGHSVTTTMSDEELLSFYGKQLADSGWTQAPRRPAGQSWTKADSEGTREFTIVISGPPDQPNCKVLSTDVSVRR